MVNCRGKRQIFMEEFTGIGLFVLCQLLASVSRNIITF